MPTSPAPLIATDSALAQLASWLRAAGDPLRLTILRLLERDAFGVLELCFLLDSKQPSLSHHLKILLHAGLVTTRRERTTVFYRRDPSGAEAGSLKRRLMAELDEGALPLAVMQRLKTIHEQRAQASQRFLLKTPLAFAASKSKSPHLANTVLWPLSARFVCQASYCWKLAPVKATYCPWSVRILSKFWLSMLHEKCSIKLNRW